MKIALYAVAAFAALTLGAAACSSPPPQPTATPTATPTAIPVVPTAAASPTPTQGPSPSATLAPLSSPSPTPSPRPLATFTPTALPRPAPTPLPTMTPIPTRTPTPLPTPTLAPPPPPPLPQPPQSPAVTDRSRVAPAGAPLASLPDFNRVVFSAADASGFVRVTGQAGAVPGRYSVFVQALQTGASVTVLSSADGSFQTQVPALDGSTIVVSYGSVGNEAWTQGSPAVEASVNVPRPRSSTDIPFTLGGIDGFGDGYWTASGVANGWSFQAGNTIRYTLTIVYASPNNVPGMDLSRARLPEISLGRISDSEGRAVQNTLVPVLTTVTGLPLFASRSDNSSPWRFDVAWDSIASAGNTITMVGKYSFAVPRHLPAGYYVPKVNSWQPGQLWTTGSAPPTRGLQLYSHGLGSRQNLPAIRIGSAKEPRVPWMLLANTLSNGTRGTVAQEDKGAFDLGTKVTFNADKFILPKDDAQTGATVSYRLEPFLPTIGFSMGGPSKPVPPLVSFVFPSGELHVSIKRPNGQTDDLGRAPFRTARTIPVFGTALDRTLFGPTSLESLYELTTLDPAFNYQFPSYGRFVVTMEGWVQDATGVTYRSGGSYEVYIAKTLDLDLGTFLSTPFQVGDTMSPVVNVKPGVPADVRVDLKLFPNSSAKDVVAKTASGKANHFGYFHPGASAQPLRITAAGEYVVDVSASYTDARGVMWMGAVRGASVVETQNTTLIAHGRRGIKDPDQRTRTSPIWFFQRKIDPPSLTGEGNEIGGAPQLLFPYHTGDITWAADADGAIFAELSLQDDQRLTKLNRTVFIPGSSQPTDMGAIGEIDVSMPDIDLNGADGRPEQVAAVQYPELIKTWAYYYLAVQRPGVTVRSIVGSGEVDRAYWQFGDPYNGQLGNGSDGDKEGDIKLQYGGVVYRDDTGVNQYAIYGSMAVMIQRGSPLGQRTFPPFNGAAGGPSGGPILTMNSRDVEIFMTPVGVMPGAVLEAGDTFAYSGAIWPTLPSKVDVTVTAPSGAQTAISGRGNKVGHFYNPAADFVVTEPGRYTVRVQVTHDGATSAGPVQAPFPTGGILGVQDGMYSFYVVPRGSSNYLSIDTPAEGRTRSGETPFAIAMQLPAGLSSPSVHYTVDLTGTVLASGGLTPTSGVYRYSFNEAASRQIFPNLDSGDTIVVTLVATGRDSSGRDTAYASRVLFQGARVYAFSEP